ncbi:MAG: DUF3793 family protein [Desulfuromonadales bacterium]|nr:DUF3793 family protein [Desulfuromonadales bacterium]
MQKSDSSCSAPQVGRELTWIDVAGLFPAPKECLAAFLAVAAAEVLSGAKPANMIRIPNQRLPCGRRIYRLWQKFGSELIKDLPLSVRPMRTEKNSALLLIYRSDLLERRLRGRTMQTFLARQDYPQPLTLEKTLQHLQESFRCGIPHEVGMFLGYPVKDVKGFMEQKTEPSPGRGMWRIYGPPQRSLRLSNLYRSKRQEMITKLATGSIPLQLLQVA